MSELYKEDNICIVCKLPLREPEIDLNMEFHSGCSKDIIRLALKALKILDNEDE